MEGSSWAKEKLFQILDYRYVTRRPTIITTAVQVDNLDEWLKVRAADAQRCTLIAYHVSSYSYRMNRK
jgi:DNA replication protein DnaC